MSALQGLLLTDSEAGRGRPGDEDPQTGQEAGEYSHEDEGQEDTESSSHPATSAFSRAGKHHQEVEDSHGPLGTAGAEQRLWEGGGEQVLQEARRPPPPGQDGSGGRSGGLQDTRPGEKLHLENIH